MTETTEDRHPVKVACTLLVTLILAVAAALRLHDLDRTSLWYDEAVSWSQSNGSLSALLASVATDNYPPLHNIILWLTIPIIGDGETALRLPSVLLGLLAIWLSYLVGKMLGGRITGLLAAALLAISPFHIWYSTEARMYALLAACGLGYLLSTLKVLQTPSTRWFTLLATSGALFLYSHVYALLTFAAVGTLCACLTLQDLVLTGQFRRSNAFRACLAMAISTVAFLPWLILLAIRARSVAEAGFWIAYPDLVFVKNMAFSITGSLILFWILAGLGVACLLPSTFFKRTSMRHRKGDQRAFSICLAYTLGPVILAYLYSILVQPILFDRYLIAAWPGLLLLAAAGAHRLSPRFAPIALFVAALILTFPELKFTLTQKVRPDWRGIAQAYLSERAPKDQLYLYKGFTAPALDYYLRMPGSFVAVEKVEELASPPFSSAPDNRWLLVVHSNAQETAVAKQIFGAEESEPFARTFGWGASGLSLFQNSTRTTDAPELKKKQIDR
ncbi:MAG: glycosyltransferase family 39 protein [Roseibium sp.]|uniref:glycosyltransferase family 39 protein n=1 Tax=Roseibium sp. TaxID=1936156 RepID=UPI0026296904|nr:glycosyltransferase family 39 protein [Roseibium sp.]MCV0429142.1 glycosyltransferase family 39 protein [Roseibium sp.]